MKGFFRLPWVLLAVFVIASFLAIGFFFNPAKQFNNSLKYGNQSGGQTSSDVVWISSEDRWEARGNPPDCPNPLILATPVDLSLATTILYPGQMRGGDYKAHGGFRFDSSNNDAIIVRVPMDGVLTDASRYTVQGEIQYTLDFQTPCGIRYRFGHLLTLAAKFAKVAEALPEPKEGDSRTSPVNPEVSVMKGEVIATAVGLKNNRNVFVDWGVYDLRRKNQASEDPAWARQHHLLAQYGICWFDLLPPEDGAKVKSLPPADSVSGAQSAYCK